MKKLCSLLAAVLLTASLGVPVSASAGRVISPVPNEDNSITFETSDETIAQLYFQADSDPQKFYVDVSTSWSDSEFADAFSSLDAYLFSFTVNGAISSRKTPTIYLFSPFDSDVTEKGYVYQEQDGKLTDVTDSFHLAKNEGGQMLYACRTSAPGRYIVSQDPVDASLLSAEEDGVTRIQVTNEPQTEKPAVKTPAPTGLRLPSRDGK